MAGGKNNKGRTLQSIANKEWNDTLVISNRHFLPSPGLAKDRTVSEHSMCSIAVSCRMSSWAESSIDCCFFAEVPLSSILAPVLREDIPATLLLPSSAFPPYFLPYVPLTFLTVAFQALSLNYMLVYHFAIAWHTNCCGTEGTALVAWCQSPWEGRC